MKRAVLLVLGCVFFGAGLSEGQTPKKEDVPKYIKNLTAKDAKDRIAACKGIAAIGQLRAVYTKSAVDPLCDVVKKDGDAKVRAEAASALGVIDADPEKAAPVLIEALSDKDEGVQVASITSLGLLGPGAKEAVPMLKEINDKYRAEQQKAREERAKFQKDGDKEKAQAAQRREQAAQRFTQACQAALQSIGRK